MEFSLTQMEFTLTKQILLYIWTVGLILYRPPVFQVKEVLPMSHLIPGNQKHLTLKDREYIHEALNEGRSFKDIARFLCKDPSTISKEVKLHRSMNTWNKGSFNNPQNFCVKRFHCRKTNVCDKLFLCDRKCRSCHKCNQVCKDFQRETCKRLDKAPFVCNGCLKPKHKCTVPVKYDYDPLFAHRKYEEKLSSSRQGINRTKAEIHRMDEVIKPLVSQGQSPYHILCNHPELDMSVKTMYNYIDSGVLLTRNIDLKRKVKFKKRKDSSRKKTIKDRAVFNGRTYADFKRLGISSADFVEMDTVISASGSQKCILTFCFPDTGLFLAYLLNRCTQGAVKEVFDRLEKKLGTYDFLRLFHIILTDRGAEFGDPEALETGFYGIERSSIYYCDPMCSGQKGAVEEAHTMLRMIIPKKTVFTDLSQWKLKKAVDHINSTPRARLNGMTPYEAAFFKYGYQLLNVLGLKPIYDKDEVTLTPRLIDPRS